MMSQSLVTHRVRFFVYEPYSINCIAFNPTKRKAALLRRSVKKHQSSLKNKDEITPSVIEIWNFQHKASFLEQVIHENPDQSNLLEGIAWSSSGRLFSCGLNSYLNEYDLANGQIQKSYCVNSDPVWCMAVDPNDTLIAAGTEQGFICIFRILPDCLQYENVLQKNENRILCMEWHRRTIDNVLLLVCGSIDFIKIYDYQQKRCTDFIKVGNNSVVVWCLRVLSDYTIVSGDSNGTTSFWNGQTLTLIRSYKSHDADILTVAASEDDNMVFAGGVDPTIVQFNRNYDSSDTWIVSFNRKPHTHDVRALFVHDDWLISGGLDSRLCQTSITVARHHINHQSIHVSHLTNLSHRVAWTTTKDGQNYLALMYDRRVQIWKLGAAEYNLESGGVADSSPYVSVTSLKLLDNAEKMIDVDSRRPIIAFDFNSEWLIYANYDTVKILRWSENGIDRVKLLHDPIPNVTNIRIINSDRFVVSYGKNFEILKLDRFGIVSEYSGVSSTRCHIQRIVSSAKKLVIQSRDEGNTLSVYDLDDYSLKTSFPSQMMPVAMQINQSNEHLWVAYPNAFLLEYDLNGVVGSQTYFLSQYKSNENRESKIFNRYWPLKQIAFSGDHFVLLSDDNNLYAFNIAKERITKCDKYHHIVCMGNLGSDQLVIVEVTPQMIFQTLPASLRKRAFGA